MAKQYFSEALQKRMESVGVTEADIEEEFVTSSGPGGQNVNKLNTCVVLSCEKFDIQIKFQETRSQYKNRVGARELLCSMLESRKKARALERKQAIRKKKLRYRKRSRKQEEARLKEKRHKSMKKKNRGRVDPGSY